jgi:hypothetical protein
MNAVSLSPRNAFTALAADPHLTSSIAHCPIGARIDGVLAVLTIFVARFKIMP